jgi:hypothetical protein
MVANVAGGTVIVEAIVVVGAAVAVAAWGFRFADRASRVMEARAARQSAPAPERQPSRRAFTPMQLDASTLKWPSEIQERRENPFKLEWPSASWPADWKKTGAPAGVPDFVAAEVTQASLNTEEAKPARKVEPKATKRDAPAPAAHKADRARPAPAELPSVLTAPVVFDALPQPTRPAQGHAEPKVAAAPDDAAAIRALVKERGLAAAVDQVRRTRSLDFQQAAQVVARAIRG